MQGPKWKKSQNIETKSAFTPIEIIMFYKSAKS